MTPQSDDLAEDAGSPEGGVVAERRSRLVRAARAAHRGLLAFLHVEASSGIILIAAAALALLVANSPFSGVYQRLWTLPLGIRLGPFQFEHSLEWFVNDGLMVGFFFVVGLEIRREMHQGELSDWSRAAVPVGAALGGLALPAALYLFLAPEPEVRSGWGVPMATDIAFALGILSLLGNRVPASLRVLLLALAVIDDLGAIFVIAVFYSGGISLNSCLVSLLGFVGVVLLQRFGVRRKFAYFFPAVVAWAGVYEAGFHPTIAGVVLGMMTPVVPLPAASDGAEPAEDARPIAPAEELIEGLHPWIAFMVMPIFALANAGFGLSGFSPDANSTSAMTGIVVGLLAGKPLGIVLAVSALLVLRIGKLPAGLGTRHVVVLGTVAGIGFTMSLFVAQLAFEEGPLLSAAKLAVLVASGVAGVLALIVGRVLLRAEG